MLEAIIPSNNDARGSAERGRLGSTAATTEGTTLIGCLAGQDGDDLYTLAKYVISQWRGGVRGDDLKKGCRLQGKTDWDLGTTSRSEGKKVDATREQDTFAI